ncbi:hypothetical protein NX794_25825 [Streptomyces sp. LP11]|uniref:Uncharacterized protein n=1 Tax=Streptomyces pyxinicus TaxID=2970331 RepID=A0ABT2B871_9ACTN|nr:hypothetical protein [Streptomyces sp. LP11]MCS0604610.1 hypothetical protein [Streptomyces sp. LP11]
MPATAELIGAALALFCLGILTFFSVRSITRRWARSLLTEGEPRHRPGESRPGDPR